MYKIGVDLGGTNIVAGVVNEENRIIGKGWVQTRRNRSGDEVIEDIKESIRLAVKQARIDWSEVSSIGIGTPGTVNRKTGVIEYANNLDFNNVPIKQIMEDEFKLPVYIENDANAAAKAESVAGAAKGSKYSALCNIMHSTNARLNGGGGLF